MEDVFWGAVVGTLGTLLVMGILRVLLAGLDVVRHDRLARERDDDLAQWVADEHVALRERLRTHVEVLASAGALDSGRRGELTAIRRDALHRYRDQETQARRDIAAIRDREGWAHEVWRNWRRLPTLRTPDEASSVIEHWRTPGEAHKALAGIDDPTVRSLAAVRQSVESGAMLLPG